MKQPSNIFGRRAILVALLAFLFTKPPSERAKAAQPPQMISRKSVAEEPLVK